MGILVPPAIAAFIALLGGQTRDPVQLLVNVVGEAAPTCGVRPADLERTLGADLRDLNMTATPSSTARRWLAEVHVSRLNGVCVASASTVTLDDKRSRPFQITAFRSGRGGLGGAVADALRREAFIVYTGKLTTTSPARADQPVASGKCAVTAGDTAAMLAQAGGPFGSGWHAQAESVAVRPPGWSSFDGMPTGPEYCATFVQVWNDHDAAATLVVTGSDHRGAVARGIAEQVERIKSRRAGS